jgi:hypothetical protein
VRSLNEGEQAVIRLNQVKPSKRIHEVRIRKDFFGGLSIKLAFFLEFSLLAGRLQVRRSLRSRAKESARCAITKKAEQAAEDFLSSLLRHATLNFGRALRPLPLIILAKPATRDTKAGEALAGRLLNRGFDF